MRPKTTKLSDPRRSCLQESAHSEPDRNRHLSTENCQDERCAAVYEAYLHGAIIGGLGKSRIDGGSTDSKSEIDTGFNVDAMKNLASWQILI